MENNKQEIQILNKESIEKIKSQVRDKKEDEIMRNEYRNRAFILLWQLVFIIAVPAAVAMYFGKKLDQGDGKTYTLIFLGVALVITWTMIIVKYKRYAAQVKEVEDKIKNKDK